MINRILIYIGFKVKFQFGFRLKNTWSVWFRARRSSSAHTVNRHRRVTLATTTQRQLSLYCCPMCQPLSCNYYSKLHLLRTQRRSAIGVSQLSSGSRNAHPAISRMCSAVQPETRASGGDCLSSLTTVTICCSDTPKCTWMRSSSRATGRARLVYFRSLKMLWIKRSSCGPCTESANAKQKSPQVRAASGQTDDVHSSFVSDSVTLRKSTPVARPTGKHVKQLLTNN